ncbi:helix-turn-helix domain-containing protein [Streptomyces sp. NPDC001851]|uniref:helix-turn-helix domain-containing protein n=1 Tax=Streptomyces sp. NPDC001851 TaxID=3154529 RepID=UPI00332A5550
MLTSLGMDASESDFYREVLRRTTAGVEEIGAVMGLSVEAARTTADRLLGLGLLTGSTTGELRAVHPELACTPLLERARLSLARRQQELELARLAISELTAEFGTAPTSSYDETQVYRGSDRAWSCLERIAATSASSVQCMAAAGAAPGVGDTTDYTAIVDLARFAARRGTRVRVLLLDSIDILPSLMQGAQAMADAGVEVRTVPTLPVWVFIVDNAYVATALDPADNQAGIMTVRTPGAVAAAADLFKRHWRGATPFGSAGQDSRRALMEQHLDLVVLLADEVKDEAIARRLGVSRSTARRRIKDLCRAFEVTGRTQLVVKACQLGLLD